NARRARDGAVIKQGVIYVAPNDQHLLIEDDRIRLSRGPRVNRTRPAIDPLEPDDARSLDGDRAGRRRRRTPACRSISPAIGRDSSSPRTLTRVRVGAELPDVALCAL